MASNHWIGVDENGLGARLGPLIVTGVLAKVDPRGERALRRLPQSIRADLDDSKRLIAHGDVRLGEAWARALLGPSASNPEALLDTVLLEPREKLSAPCPGHVRPQCWSSQNEEFSAEPELCRRIERHLSAFESRGITFIAVRTSVICSKRLNELRSRGINRFVADLHAMEALVLALRARAGTKIKAVCGKVGGIAEYGKFFGPLSGFLHTELEQGREKSSYHVPNVGQLCFLRDADAKDPLVMLSSLVGKYLRELLMARITRFYPEPLDGAATPSGYHDPVSDAFVQRTALVRRQRAVPDTCFERARDERVPAESKLEPAPT